MKKIAIIGTQGVPAKYGGFESLVENIIGQNCSSGINYTVLCSSLDMPRRFCEYKGSQLKYVSLHANGISSVLYDIISMIRVKAGYDTILILGTSGCIFLPIFKLLTKSRIIVNIDGLEHRREKWGILARKFLLLSENFAIRYADVIIADNKGIQDYVTDTYHRMTKLIAYGGDHVLRNVPIETERKILNLYKLQKNDYAITVCRIEPENNPHIILEAFSQADITLVFIGNWTHSQYARNLKEQYSHFTNIKLLDSIYDLNTLYTLRSNAAWYIHGHSAGGTNPSLVEAMFFGKPIAAFDVIYNRETTNNKALYFTSSKDLLNLLSLKNQSGADLRKYADEHYTWKHIAKLYESLY